MDQSLGVETHAASDEGRGESVRPTCDDVARISVAVLTAGIDKHYAYGLTTALGSKGAVMDVIGSDALDGPELRGTPGVNFLNLRGDQRSDANLSIRVVRILVYYAKLIHYAAGSKAKVFHILWNNRFQTFDRTFLMLYYKFLGKKVVLTAHNVNTDKRDAKDTHFNRLTQRVQYRLADHIFVHTEKMKSELTGDFGVQGSRVTVIPFGINNAVPRTNLSPTEAKRRLGISDTGKTILFFGRITPYKGLDYLVEAFQMNFAKRNDYRLIIAGRLMPGCEQYGHAIQKAIQKDVSNGRILVKSGFIPDDEIEVYFKAADILVLPYRHIYQSGVLFLGYSFGLPVIAADVGCLKEDIVEEETGFVFKPGDPTDLAKVIERYFTSDLFANLSSRRKKIEEFATRHHSWETVGQLTMKAYSELIRVR
jgi:D-inositol-3-phosphate glycosyltransferase